MVLATNIKAMGKFLIIASVLTMSVSCSKKKDVPKYSNSSEKTNESIVTDTTVINGTLIELIDKNGKTEINTNSKKYFLSGKIIANAPSKFIRSHGKVLSFTYPKINVDKTIIIQGKGGIQGIIFKKDSIICVEYITTSSPYNITEGADEILYWDFAHRTYKR